MFVQFSGHMYTFVCAQEFRRDEFAWHSKAVHNDILGGMNNWLEHRCPMAVYGCGFCHRRMFPGRTYIYSIRLSIIRQCSPIS